MKKLLTLFYCVFSYQAWGQTPESAPILLPVEDEVVIEQNWLVEVNYEEPVFSDSPGERSLAEATAGSGDSDFKWQGQLKVLDEIPYSYPSISRSHVRDKALAELEEEEKSNNK